MRPGMEATTSPSAVAGKFYVGPVEILSELVKFPITCTGLQYSLWDFGSRLRDFVVVGPVDKKVSFHSCELEKIMWMLLKN